MECVLKSCISSQPDDSLRGFPGVKVSAVPIIILLAILKDRTGDKDLANPLLAFSLSGDLALAKLKAEDHIDCRLMPAKLDPTGEREEPLFSCTFDECLITSRFESSFTLLISSDDMQQKLLPSSTQIRRFANTRSNQRSWFESTSSQG
jgi:hypothetical protein